MTRKGWGILIFLALAAGLMTVTASAQTVEITTEEQLTGLLCAVDEAQTQGNTYQLKEDLYHRHQPAAGRPDRGTRCGSLPVTWKGAATP